METWRYYNKDLCAVRNDGLSSGLVDAHKPILAFLAGGGTIEPEFNVTLMADKYEIDSDNLDEAIVSISWVDPGAPPPSDVEIVRGGLQEVVDLTSGPVTLSPIKADFPCDIEISTTNYRADPVVVEAVSV